MVKFIVSVIVLSLICGSFALDTNFSPVLVFKNKGNPTTFGDGVISSTTPVKQGEFEQYFDKIDGNQKVVICLTDDLSPEDLSIRNVHKERGFQNLATQVSIERYLPYVENAVDNKFIQRFTMGVKLHTLTTTNEVEPEPSDDENIIIVSLPACDDDEESRFHCMAHIDRACYALSQLDEYKDALFILTSEMNSHLSEVHSRKARDVTTPAANDATVYSDAISMVYLKGLMVRNKKGTDTPVSVTVTATKVSNNEIKVDFTGQNSVSLVFQLDEGEYVILNQSKSKAFDKPIDLQSEVAWPQEFSFACVSSLYMKNPDKNAENVGLYFHNLQIQLNFTNDGGAKFSKFGDSYDCVGFTSPAIWSGLFITFLLLGIVSTGITYIMDIRTVSFHSYSDHRDVFPMFLY